MSRDKKRSASHDDEHPSTTRARALSAERELSRDREVLKDVIV